MTILHPIIFTNDYQLPDDEQGVPALYHLEQEELKKNYALYVAESSRCGLAIHIYETHTDYFLDPGMPVGTSDTKYYNG